MFEVIWGAYILIAGIVSYWIVDIVVSYRKFLSKPVPALTKKGAGRG
jgi:hypothetical protein